MKALIIEDEKSAVRNLMALLGEVDPDIEVIDGSFEVALDLARKRLDSGLVDVFVSAGSNASLLRRGISAPVATIQLSGFDILQALIKAGLPVRGQRSKTNARTRKGPKRTIANKKK